jgi:hypothetical protein
VARFGEELVRLGASFSCLRFGAERARWEGVPGDDSQHFVVELAPAAGLAAGGVDRVGEVAHGVQGAFEAQLTKLDMVALRGLLHDEADELAADGIHAQFPFDHRGAFAAKHCGAHGGFDLPVAQFDV